MADAFWANLDTTSRLVGLSPGILRAWHRSEILRPHQSWERGRGLGRLYSFQDLIGLHLLARLRGKAASDQLRKIQPWILDMQPTSINPQPVDWERFAVTVDDRSLTFIDIADDGTNRRIGQTRRTAIERAGQRGRWPRDSHAWRNGFSLETRGHAYSHRLDLGLP
jgi:DNA-binding transcriptional MerR regulator